MANSSQFNLGSVYDLTTFAPALLGTFRNVRVEGIVDHRAASQYIDPAAYHANVYGTLPANTAPNDYRRYYYLILLMPNGTRTALGLPWVDGSTVTLKERNKITIHVEDVGPDDIENLKLALSANGYRAVTIDID